jgi:hypothetical protein
MIKLALREGEAPLAFLQRIAEPHGLTAMVTAMYVNEPTETRDTPETLTTFLEDAGLLEYAVVSAASNQLQQEHIFATFPMDDQRKWIRVIGKVPLDIGILVGDEGLSIDIWNVDGTELHLEFAMMWEELGGSEE